MQALKTTLTSVLESLPHSPDKRTLDEVVASTLKQGQTSFPAEIVRNQWEFVLKDEIFTFSTIEGQALRNPNTTYYADLRSRLDLVLTFTEHGICDQSFVFHVLYDLLETQTIASCSHIFSWIEERMDRLTVDMVPQKGKALILLRALNDLLRRLSKMGNTTMFCGRILTFLSRVFPLGERSGVNLRGGYGPVWDGPGVKGSEGDIKMQTREEGGEKSAEGGEEDKMEVDGVQVEEQENREAKKNQQKADFYDTFWSLQLPFSRPPLFSEPGTFVQFKEAVNKILPVIKEATTKDRALMGSKSLVGNAGGPSLKRKRDSEGAEDNTGKEYFFAKYLTSPELLDLEIADTHFRRQFLFQLLILLNHLLTFTKTVKATWSTPRNRSLQIDFTLEAEDAQWVQDIVAKATEELRQTAPSGRAFAETVQIILEREKNWVKWKNELCSPFDKNSWAEEVEGVEGQKRRVGLEEATREARKKMRLEPEPWPHSLVEYPILSPLLTFRREDMDLQFLRPGDVKDFVRKVKQEDMRIDMRRSQLIKAAQRIAQARKAAAPKEETPSPSKEAVSVPSISQEPSAQPSTTRMASSNSAPLHPSLPAKPGTAPPTSTSLDSVPQVPVRASTPIIAPAPLVEAAPTLPPDNIISGYEENKQRWSWLALRTARDQYLQHFGKIGTGDVTLLAQEIEKEKKERERAAVSEEPGAGNGTTLVAGTTGAGEERGASPMAAPGGNSEKVTPRLEESPNGSAQPKDPEGDVKMEER
ncbi:uncharacterized protein FIBRA_00906 [Fibroporia radiculosa]|uniref:Uncharacterized protein n=1 Tax=Fibroporia radiculosa TaxID=599839 RepID=J4H0T3_9APHY|nr:uncharacterized protein FIBRA_00906 [Fibroporia radiculosa]CCL98899.1 predicted protein [Fibroporia radiculosa]